MQAEDTTEDEWMGVVCVPLYARSGAIQGHALVDSVDLPWIGLHTWRMDKGYARRYAKIDGRTRAIFMHHGVLDLKPSRRGLQADHINRCTWDNRRRNLRAIPHAGNMQNRRSHKGSTSRYRGVSWDPAKGLWLARVKFNGKDLRFGRFRNEEDAGRAALEARRRLMPYATD